MAIGPERLSAAALVALACAAVGCRSGGSTVLGYRGHDAPPIVDRAGPRPVAPLGPTVVVVGAFADPTVTSVPWRSVGLSLSENFARTILVDGAYDARIDAAFGRSVEAALALAPGRRRTELERLRAARPEVDYVVVGRVTDFVHSTDLPDDLRRRRLFGSRREAIVAIQMDVVRMTSGEVVATDHVVGYADATRVPPAELYKGIDPKSYLFWSTPLGRASRSTIDRCARILETTAGAAGDVLRLTGWTGTRRVEVVGGAHRGIRAGRYFAYAIGDDQVTVEPVYDPDTRQPVEVRIDRGGGRSADGFMLGRPPLAVDLRRIVLRPLPPPPLRPPAPEGAVADAAESAVVRASADSPDAPAPTRTTAPTAPSVRASQAPRTDGPR
ncbi:MAG: hypothetical protein KF817_12430 [Phycisphaeraceae bacterium]|nr:hypothetical protein [Phycisphaeraceae bacterium]